MAEGESAAHRDGEIISVAADDNGVIRVESYRDGEPFTQVFDREGYTRDGVYHAPEGPQPSANDVPAGQFAEGEIVGARIAENGDIQLQRYEEGEVRTSSFGESHYTQSEEAIVRHYGSDEIARPDSDPPVPTQVNQPDGTYIAQTVDEFGNARSITFDTESVRQLEHVGDHEAAPTVQSLDNLVHAAAREAELQQLDADPPAPTVVLAADGTFHTTTIDQYGNQRELTIDVEPVFRPAPEVREVIVDFEIVRHIPADDAHGNEVTVSTVHEGAIDTDSPSHHDSASHHDGTDAGGDAHGAAHPGSDASGDGTAQ
jgi:hypothetical protein